MREFTEYALRQLEKAEHIDRQIRDFFLSKRPGIIYGAGWQGFLTAGFAQFFEKQITSFLVSPTGSRSTAFYKNIPLYHMDELPPSALFRDFDTIIAVNQRYSHEIFDALQRAGFSNIFLTTDWASTNEALWNFWYHCYFDFHLFTRHEDRNGEEYFLYNFEDGAYKFYFPSKDDVFRSNMYVQFNDIVLPSLLNDYSYIDEGPYELGNVTVKKGDIVFDCGANVGLFSGVAAAKGAEVYAFEPTPVTCKYLERSLSFYNNTTIHQYAVAEDNGKSKFYINDLQKDNNLGVNGFNPMLSGVHFDSIEVSTLSLDTFVKEHAIARVDFIKADIEGAERDMLKGAKQILAEFAPKLALCTYHLPDDPEVMERLILEANPNYIIQHKYSKLYAYCPNSMHTAS